MGPGELNAGRGGGAVNPELLSVASCYRSRDKLRPGGPLGSNADFTYQSDFSSINFFTLPPSWPGFLTSSSYLHLNPLFHLFPEVVALFVNDGDTITVNEKTK